MMPLSTGCLICVLHNWAPETQISLWNNPLATLGTLDMEKSPSLYLDMGARFYGEFSAHRLLLLQITTELE